MTPQTRRVKEWWVPNNWAEEQALRITQEVHRLRGTRSAQWLADRTAALGHTVTRSVIADMENGRRKYVTTAELIVLARALNTTPVALLYPDPWGVVDMLPQVKASEFFALQWFSGFVDIPRPEVADDGQEYMRNLRPVQTVRQIWDLEEQKAALMKEGLELRGQEKRNVLRAIADVQRDIDKLRAASDGG